MKNNIPIIAFSAWSGTGKTTIIEKLIKELKDRGLQVAAIKHDAHDFDIDQEGKDSWRFTQAGADITVISSNKKTALIQKRSLDLNSLISMVSDVDIIIAEGFNNEDLPCIGISRKATGKGFRKPVSSYIAVVTDEIPTEPRGCEDANTANQRIPIFSLEDIYGLADFILQYISMQ